MNDAVLGANAAAAKNAIAYNAAQCFQALGCADTAASAGMKGMAESFRRLAAYHADRAWEWVPALHQGRTA